MDEVKFLEMCYKVAEVYDDASTQEEFEEMVGKLYQEYFTGEPNEHN